MLLHRRRISAGEEGYGLAVVLVLAFVMTILAATAFSAMRSTELNTREQRNITSARGVADGGAEQLIYELGLTGTQWTDYPGQTFSGTLGDGAWTATVATHPSGANQRVVNVTGEYPAGSGDTVQVEVVVERSAPAAFDFAMFADSNIIIHHHSGSTWLAPRVFTAGGVHSNGAVAIDASAEFDLTDPDDPSAPPGKFRAVGHIDMPASSASVGSHPNLSFAGGSVPPGGYSWRYDIGNGDLCYPGAIPHGAPGHNVNHSVGTNGCTGPKFVGGVRIAGTVEAGGLTVDTNGVVDGDVIVDDDGAFDVSNGTITGSQVRSAEPPAALEFPSLDFESTYRVRAQAQESGPCPVANPALLSCGVQHIFTDDGDFYDLITNPATGFYRTASHTAWTPADGKPAYILARGDWYIEGGISFTVSAITSAMAGHGLSYPGGPPPVVIAGSLVSPDGGATMQGRLYMVGRGNRTDFLDPTKPRGINVNYFLNKDNSGTPLGPVAGFPSVEPAVLGAGSKIDGKDFDDDSSWETAADLETAKSNATWVRGLVYSGEWDDGTKTSSAGDQHWHNYDPKNEARIYGAQVGGKLHNCNNFEFVYDDVIRNAFGFTSSSGAVEVLSWDEQ